MSTRSVALFVILTMLIGAAPSTVQAAWSWRDGSIAYMWGCDPISGGCQDNGAGFYASQAWDPALGLPRANTDVFYVKIYMQGIVSGARMVAPYFVPPPETKLFANAEIAPVRCFYSNRTGGSLREFTGTTVSDNSVPGSTMVIGGCPQPPYPEKLFDGFTGYRIARNCDYPGHASDCSQNWPMGSGAGYEFWVPIYVEWAMDGISDSTRITWPITVLDPYGGIRWVYPYLPLYASPESLPPSSADMRVVLQQGTGAPGRTLVQGLCINGGPSDASSVRCQFGGLPQTGTIVMCDPAASPVALLPSGESIVCSADFPTPQTPLSVYLQATSITTDGSTGNNVASVQIVPPATSADLSASLVKGTAPSGMTHVDATCTNNGPNTALNVMCLFTTLPDGSSFGCSKDMPASLAVGESITCFARYSDLTTTSTVAVKASSSTTDPEPEGNVATLQVPAPPAADLRTTLTLGQSTQGRTRLLGTCTNVGPAVATDVTCGYRNLPAGSNVSCDLASPVASLAVKQAITCNADFPNQVQALSVTIEASSPMADPTPGNDAMVLQVPPQGGITLILRNGFE
jgi:hypothetical protein